MESEIQRICQKLNLFFCKNAVFELSSKPAVPEQCPKEKNIVSQNVLSDTRDNVTYDSSFKPSTVDNVIKIT